MIVYVLTVENADPNGAVFKVLGVRHTIDELKAIVAQLEQMPVDTHSWLATVIDGLEFWIGHDTYQITAHELPDVQP